MEHKKSKPKRKITRRQFIFGALGGATVTAGVLDVRYFEPRDVQLTKNEIYIPNLPEKLDGYTVVQLSDTHRGPKTPDAVIERAVEMCNSVRPDAVCLTGDYVHRDPADFAPCFDILSRIRAEDGVFAVLGNHDFWASEDTAIRTICKTGFTLVTDRSVEVREGLVFTGVDDQWEGEPDYAEAFSDYRDDKANVILAHIPEAIDDMGARRGLVLSGHTHGGQSPAELLPRKWRPRMLRGKYLQGFYEHDDMLLYVNRGVGMSILPVRIMCRPEVASFTLRSGRGNRPEIL